MSYGHGMLRQHLPSLYDNIMSLSCSTSKLLAVMSWPEATAQLHIFGLLQPRHADCLVPYALLV